VFAVAIMSVVRDGRPPGQVVTVLVVLVAIALAVTVNPMVDAALARAGENAADAYAAGLGLGPDLALALGQLNPCRSGTLRDWAQHTHPATDARQRRLIGAPPSRP
jgi:hypothetical protein